MIKRLLLTVACLLGAISLRAQTQPAKPDASHSSKNQAPPAFDTKNMDKSVKPGDDFFRYANGGWLKRTPIPPEYARWGSFNALIEENNDALHKIAEKAAKVAPKTEDEGKLEEAGAADLQKVGDFYASGMNQKEINAARVKPLQDEFQRIEAMKDTDDLVKEIGHLHSIGVGGLFGFTSGNDDKNSSMVIAQAFQGGLGMPDRDYYTKDDDASKKLRDQYVAHVTKMFTLLGDSKDVAAKNAKTVMDIETSLAKAARTRVELRDPQKNYNKMQQAELQKLTPDFNWNEYFEATNLPAAGDINVGPARLFQNGERRFQNGLAR